MLHLDMEYYVNQETQILLQVIEDFEKNTTALDNLNNNFDRIVIYATGSSANAAYSAAILLAKVMKMNVEIKEPAMAAYYDLYLDDRTLYLAISQGGHSASILHVVEAIENQGYQIYAITAPGQSPLTALAKNILYLGFEEDMPFVTAGESATIVYLWLIGIALAKRLKTSSLDELNDYQKQIVSVVKRLPVCIEQIKSWFENEKMILNAQKRFICISYGAGYGSAREFETKFTETVRQPSSGFELEEFMHGPYLGIHRSDCIFLFGTGGILEKRQRKLYEFLKRHVDRLYYFSFNKGAYEDSCLLGLDTLEELACLPFNIVVHLTSWYLSQMKQIDLSKSSYPDFDEMMKSKV